MTFKIDIAIDIIVMLVFDTVYYYSTYDNPLFTFMPESVQFRGVVAVSTASLFIPLCSTQIFTYEAK
jgi:hypothetical protein